MSNTRKRKLADLMDHNSGKMAAMDDQEVKVAPNVLKVYTYSWDMSESWTLSEPENLSSPVWEMDELQKLKKELNEVKSRLNDVDIGKWHSHTGSTQLGGAIQRHVAKHAQAELCTQAWCKFHEILCQFDVVHATRRGNLKTVHLCEAPGAFVASLNHFLKSRGFYSTWEWLALTSNPYYESNEMQKTVCDDRLIRETRANWFFGEDNSGDLLKVENVSSLVDRTGKWTADVVTADGSVNCSDRPAEQEQTVSPLHLAEVVSALHITAKHGAFIIKMFTMFEAQTISIMYLLNYLFTQVSVFKPVASKPGNSEVYVICIDYRGIGTHLMNKLTKLVAEKKLFVLPRSVIPESFMRGHVACCQYFTQLQTQTITLNLDLYNRECRDWLEGVMAMRMMCAKRYVEENQIAPIHKHQRLMRRSREEEPGPIPFFSVSGSFNQRVQEAALTWRDKMAEIRPQEVTSEDVTWLLPCDIVKPLNGYGLRLTVGKPAERVRSSRYCHHSLLDSYNTLIDHVQYPAAEVTATALGTLYQNLVKTMNLPPGGVTYLPVPGTPDTAFTRHAPTLSQTPSEHRILVCDVTQDDVTVTSYRDGEQASRLALYDAMASSLEVLSLGDFWACKIHSSLTRFTASVVYLLKTVFFKVTVVHLGDPHASYILGCVFIGADNCLRGRLLRARNHGNSLLQIMPVDWMEYRNFRDKLTEMNHSIVIHRLNHMIQHERQFLGLET